MVRLFCMAVAAIHTKPASHWLIHKCGKVLCLILRGPHMWAVHVEAAKDAYRR